MIKNLDESLSEATKRSYKRSFDHLKNFYNTLKETIMFPISVNKILGFTSYLSSNKLAPTTITTYLSAIAYFHKALEVTDPTNHWLVKKCLIGLKKQTKTRPEKPRVTLKSLEKLVKISKTSLSKSEKLQFNCIITILFFGLFRISELLGDRKLKIASLEKSQVKVRNKILQIELISYKHSKGEKAIVEITAQKSKYICPLKNLQKYLEHRGPGEGPLFKIGKKALTKARFNTLLKKCSETAGYEPPFTSHCFRIGGATEAALEGRTDTEIKLLGRWKSNAFIKYVRKVKPLISQ